MTAPAARRADFLMALAYATDLATGHSRDFALRSCVLAMRLVEGARFDENTRRAVYHQALLRYIGCNADSHLLAAAWGDEIAHRQDLQRVDLPLALGAQHELPQRQHVPQDGSVLLDAAVTQRFPAFANREAERTARSLAAVGVLLMTFAIDLKGDFAKASALVCLVYVAGLILAGFLPETKGRPLPE